MTPNNARTHKELAIAYFPELHPQVASRRLSLWIERDEELAAELKTAGYQRGQRLFTPKQIDILVDHLGEPGTSH